jgi:tetratricopeptide (TPR) repeat protein
MGLVLAARVAVVAAAGPAPDALTDAKRRAAADLMREGKAADAVAMLQEVIRADPEQYKDHLQLARALDKLNRPGEASEEYHRVADLMTARRVDDRAAKAEVDRRLRVLDAQSAKIAAAEEDFLKKLDALEREAVAAKDMRALQRLFALRGGVWNARGRKEGFGLELPATAEWLDAGVTVQKGVKYRVRAAGYWTINGTVRCTADGTNELPPNHIGPYGSLVAQMQNGAFYERLGTDCTFVAPATGRIQFVSNTKTVAERNNSSGSLYVLVAPVFGGGGGGGGADERAGR